jgi:hypothetical protein
LATGSGDEVPFTVMVTVGGEFLSADSFSDVVVVVVVGLLLLLMTSLL